MKKRVLSLALCLVLVVGLFSGLTVNASASKIDDLKKEVAERLIKEKIEQFKEEFEIPDLDTDAILNSFATAATEGDFGENNCLHWEVTTGVISGKTLTISGNGAMPDFDFPNGNLAPWWNYEALGMLTSFGNFKLEGELKKVVIKDGVTNVSNYALFLLPAATQVTLPDSVTSIGRYGIAMCSKLTGMSIPKAVTEIGDFCLAANGLTAVTLPDGLQSLGRGAFDTCTSLTNTTLPAAITAVPGKCFADCTKLLNVKYAGTVTAIGDLAFESCKALTAAPIPETVTEIGASAFTGCTALTDVTIPAGVTAIPDGCFQGCTALKDMKLPGTVTRVGHNAFTGCTALKDVRCYGAAPTVEPGNSEAHSFEPAIVTIHYNPDPVYGWTLDADGKWQGYTVSSKGACLHTGYGTTENTVPATCGEAGRVDTICSNCGEVISTKEIPATGEHTWDNGTVTTEPTENEPGVRTFTCAVCGATKTAPIPATGAHDYQFTRTVAPTCTAGGYDLYTCSGCGATEKRNPTDALGHKWDSGKVTKPATETETGVKIFTCTRCGETKTEIIPKLTHEHSYKAVVTAPTCTEKGYTTHTCACGDSYVDSYVLPLGHDWGSGKVTKEPTATENGIKTYICARCGETKTEVIPAGGCPSAGFTDVPGEDNWAHAGIDYCVANGLMSGVGGNLFAPKKTTTRAQIVQILYNLQGEPRVYGSTPFTDLTNDWYQDAILWAYQTGVVAGTSGTTFDPDLPVTREQIAVILMEYTSRVLGLKNLCTPADLSRYPDAGSVSDWAKNAMADAVALGLISGASNGGQTYLEPQGSATREQVATILMEFCKNVKK